MAIIFAERIAGAAPENEEFEVAVPTLARLHTNGDFRVVAFRKREFPLGNSLKGFLEVEHIVEFHPLLLSFSRNK